MNAQETRNWLRQLHQSPREALYVLGEDEEEGPIAWLFGEKDWQQLKLAVMAEHKKIPSQFWPDGQIPKEYSCTRRGVAFFRDSLSQVNKNMIWPVWLALWEVDSSEALAQLWPEPNDFLLSSEVWTSVPPGPLVLPEASSQRGEIIYLRPAKAQDLKLLIRADDQRIRELAWRLAGQIEETQNKS